MAANIDLLTPDFREVARNLIKNCAEREVNMRPTEGLRDPIKQAIYWRQARTTEEINEKLEKLRGAGANFLADVILRVGPQHGKHVTNAIPGLSWHQWGEALDCIWIVDGKAVWDVDSKINGVNGYLVYAEEAEKLGLSAGAHWDSFKDYPHVQLRKVGSPLSLFSLHDIDRKMAERFGNELE